jgi:Peptidase family S41/N-terminal domain of Peptidase_S41 in eukaryotic IRBP
MTARFAGLLYALLAIALPAAAQSPAAFDAAARSAAIAKAADGLRTRYIFPDIGERAAKKIEAALGAGSYDTPGGPRAFTEHVNADLYEVAKDKHLHMDVVAPGGAPTGPTFSSEGGIVRADKLPVGVGYLEVTSFPSPDLFKPSTDRAMAALADSRALIIDLRRNGGGSPASVSYLVSHFVQPGARVHVNDFINRKAGTLEFSTQEFWTSPTPNSFAGKAVYVLTSGDTFSGGEEFAYDMQALKLATIVGETTSGGANPAGMTLIGAGMAIIVPYGRALNPITQTNWEGVGVKPDVVAPRADALKVALKLLGQPTAKTEIDTLSMARVFSPRTTPLPGAEAVVKASVQGFISGAPRYDLMTAEIADFMHADAANTHDLIAPLGVLQSVTFLALNAAGMDTYELKFANGRSVWSVALSPDLKIVGLTPLRPAAR